MPKRPRRERAAVQRLTLDLPREVYRAVKIQAIDEERSVRELAIEALTRYLRRKPKGGTP